MSDFTARIMAQLDTSQAESTLNSFLNSNRQLNIDVRLNGASASAALSNMLRQLQNQAQNAGGNAGQNFARSFNSSIGSINTNNAQNTIRSLERSLASFKFDRTQINTITQQLNSMEIAVSKIRTRITQGGGLQLNVTGIDELGRAVTIVKEFDMQTQQLTTVSKTINQSFGDISRQAQAVTESCNRIRSAIDSGGIDSSIARVTAQFEKLGASGHPRLQQISTDITELRNAQNQLVNSTDNQTLVANYERFEQILSRVRNGLQIVASDNKAMASSFQIGSLDNRIANWMTNNTRASRMFGESIESLRQRLANMGGSAPLSQLKAVENEFNNITLAANRAGVTGKSFGDQLKGAFQSLTKYVSVSMLIYQSIRAFRDMANNVLEVDTAMTELYRVTSLTSSQYEKLYDNMANSAKKYGIALSDIINSTASWVRLGFNENTSNQLAEITAMYQHVTDLDEATAVKNLVTAYKGFQEQLLQTTGGDSAKAVEYIADIYDKLGNEMPVTAAQVGEGMVKCASVMEQAGASIEEVSGMITGGGSVTQDFDAFGNALKVSTLRIRGMKGDLQALGEDVDENVESISKMQTQILNLTHGKVNIFDDNGDFRNITDIYRDIASVYNSLSGTDAADLLETIAGKNRANQIQAMLKNWGEVEQAISKAQNAEGTAAQEQEVWAGSLEAALKRLSASWQIFSNDFLNSSFLKGCVNGLTTILDILDDFVNTFGSLSTIIAGASIFSIIKSIV